MTVPTALLLAADRACLTSGCGKPHPWRYCWSCWKRLSIEEQSAHRTWLRTLGGGDEAASDGV